MIAISNPMMFVTTEHHITGAIGPCRLTAGSEGMLQ